MRVVFCFKKETQWLNRLNWLIFSTFLMTILLALTGPLFLNGATSEKRPLSLADIMRFKTISEPIISEKGDWVVYTVRPCLGNPGVMAFHIASMKSQEVALGSNPVISKDSGWIAMKINEDVIAKEKEKAAPKKKNDQPGDKTRKEDKRNIVSMALLETATGKIISFKGVDSFAFSDDSKWLVYTLFPEKPKEEAPAAPKTGQPDKGTNPAAGKNKGGEDEDKKIDLVVRHLSDGKETVIKGVETWSLDPASRFIVYFIPGSDKEKGGLFVRDLSKDLAEKKIHGQPDTKYSNLTWSKTKSRLGFLLHENFKEPTASPGHPAKKNRGNGATVVSVLLVWDGMNDRLIEAVSKKQRPQGYIIPSENSFSWTLDEERLFFGFKPVEEYRLTNSKKEKPWEQGEFDYYSLERLLDERGVDVWHWQDPQINPLQKKEWDNLKKRVYPAVYFFAKNQFTPLTDAIVPQLTRPENPVRALAFSSLPYEREKTWDGGYHDVYLVNLEDGSREKILTHFPEDGYISLSPGGRYVVYFLEKHWHLYDVKKQSARNLTEGISTPFYDEDHDYPAEVPGYGIGGWTRDDRSVLIYDKYDIWEFNTVEQKYSCFTSGQGRAQQLEFRIQRLDPEQQFFEKGEKLLLQAYSHKEKNRVFYQAVVQGSQLKPLTQGPRYYRFLARAKKAGRVLFTCESYREFPDLWVSNMEMEAPVQVSSLYKQTEPFLWGNAQLIHWNSLDGYPLDGVVITPENMVPGKRYPVLVYFYEIFSPALHRFNEVTINHRPCFPYYAGNDYIVFLPDIRYEVGRPGLSSFKCLVPGVRELISMGIADEKAIGLHGHSWSGYQSAYIVTQTDMFAAVITGAPVANMTSAYNGIRWESGYARQAQYEKSQSRIGLPLYQAPHLYLENSPVFHLERVKTPMLIEFGDSDGAVPWYQGIELYLMMRRLGKNCIFLQYNGEPHHLKSFSNKLDYTIKMKDFLDHYLKGTPAPQWITKGVPYRQFDPEPK